MVLIDWTAEFGDWLDRLENDAETDELAQRRLDYIAAQLEVLQGLDRVPDRDSAVLKRVRQSRRYPVWRLSHQYDPEVVARLIVWFTNDGRVVVALFAGDKVRMGDVFYNSVGARADAAIDRWKMETGDGG